MKTFSVVGVLRRSCWGSWHARLSNVAPIGVPHVFPSAMEEEESSTLDPQSPSLQKPNLFSF